MKPIRIAICSILFAFSLSAFAQSKYTPVKIDDECFPQLMYFYLEPGSKEHEGFISGLRSMTPETKNAVLKNTVECLNHLSTSKNPYFTFTTPNSPFSLTQIAIGFLLDELSSSNLVQHGKSYDVPQNDSEVLCYEFDNPHVHVVGCKTKTWRCSGGGGGHYQQTCAAIKN